MTVSIQFESSIHTDQFSLLTNTFKNNFDFFLFRLSQYINNGQSKSTD